VDRTTIGRVEDNMFQIAETSVSSHHCEVFVARQRRCHQRPQFDERHLHQRPARHRNRLKPGQILRLGTVELKLDAVRLLPELLLLLADAASDATAKTGRPRLASTMGWSPGVSLTVVVGGSVGGGIGRSRSSSGSSRTGIQL